MSKLSNPNPLPSDLKGRHRRELYDYILPLCGNYLPLEAYIAWKVGAKLVLFLKFGNISSEYFPYPARPSHYKQNKNIRII